MCVLPVLVGSAPLTSPPGRTGVSPWCQQWTNVGAQMDNQLTYQVGPTTAHNTWCMYSCASLLLSAFDAAMMTVSSHHQSHIKSSNPVLPAAGNRTTFVSSRKEPLCSRSWRILLPSAAICGPHPTHHRLEASHCRHHPASTSIHIHDSCCVPCSSGLTS